MFALYASIVKNLRGIVYIEELGDSVWNIIRWLIRRFRYRDLGLPPAIYRKYRDQLGDYMDGKPFRSLVYPINDLRGLVDILSRDIAYDVIESIVFSSIYISPMLVIGDHVHKLISDLGMDHVFIKDELDDRSWKLHLRIADYTILDMYRECVLEGLEAIRCLRENDVNCIRKIITKRRDRVARDKKRYWRISSGEGRVFLTYIDPLEILFNRVKHDKTVINKLLDDYASGLAIVPAIHLII